MNLDSDDIDPFQKVARGKDKGAEWHDFIFRAGAACESAESHYAVRQIASVDLSSVEINNGAVIANEIESEFRVVGCAGHSEFLAEVSRDVSRSARRAHGGVDVDTADRSVSQHGLAGSPAIVVVVRMLPVGGIVGSVANDHVAAALGDSVVKEAPAVCLKVEEGLRENSAGEHAGAWVDPSAGESRVAAIGGVINVPFRGCDREIEAVGNNSSMLRINRRIKGRVEIAGAQLTDDGAAVAFIVEDGNVVIGDDITFNRPMLLAGKVDGIIDGWRVIIGINVVRT